jgi:hypothetical protein
MDLGELDSAGIVVTFLETWGRAGRRLKRERSLSLSDYVFAVMGVAALMAVSWPVSVPVMVLCRVSRRFDDWFVRGLMRVNAAIRRRMGGDD